MKKVEVILEKCIFCGQCQAIAPEVFKLTDKLEIILDEIPEELIASTQEAIDACPTNALRWTEKNDSN